ncbi:PREDICTED: inosine triphosphate pyrophosphatase-like [Amphimedon queenslandica]|uniref:Inosine triphosphate pyrophosphatase n=1 Tax=Amphimedon queenslandica TaxID=400682 RepID=A0A1X7T0D9_AMPQE|nr:PREDICTED: inosine triphosphate pyrophosphatase-like [Amphimedon queenslandica]|eukprot:XP_003391340.2 PREDICTED: inosine triphosphate pyrophosphatase-like [Amphimedon queenslandica]
MWVWLVILHHAICLHMASKRVLTFVTGNPRKLEEVVAIIGENTPWKLISNDVDLPELQGEPDDIARDKCQMAVEKIKSPVIVEDTCLCYNALKGLPGPYIKWFLQKLGHKGLNQLLCGYDDKTAYALCTIAYCEGPGKDVKLFRGKTDGTIVEARGPHKFGWDPIFQPAGFSETYAEMETSLKNSISHRRKALNGLKDFLDTRTMKDGENTSNGSDGTDLQQPEKRPRLNE